MLRSFSQTVADPISVSVRVQQEDVLSHPDLESWTYIHCYKGITHWTFWTYFANVQTSVWGLAETLDPITNPTSLGLIAPK